ncbi:glycosyltransferase 87 family protein [Bradyrhizobium sp. NFR13]|uniref:glycosyltransferase 87 family protein n=1 Tax=Bradyrhizobium sp. NFR13 TaxID=1566285 RepID=UPI00256FB5B0|nr:glycosyltransferase 87 family protein [Bradyrhizobium sp. NFR13]
MTSISTHELPFLADATAAAPRPRDRLRLFLVVAGAMAIGAVYAGWAGEDANWDWQNYHEYNVWALLNGRYDHDVIPPGFQTHFNPIIYFPWYYLRHALPPAIAGMTMGAVHGLNLALIYWLSRIVLGQAANAMTVVAALLLAALGPMTLSEVGTSFSDILTAIPIIAGLALILAADEPRPIRYIVAGLLVGLALGFKLTNIVFAIGLAGAALAAARPLVAVTCLAIGGAIGTIMTGGAWSLMLWREFGNPFFPLLNSLFPSPEMREITLLDRQFIPNGILDGLAYPFHWLVGNFRSSELPFRDARFAMLCVLLPIAFIAQMKHARAIFSRRDLQLLIFFVTSYAVWLILFSIQRYVVALELLTGPLIVLLLVRIVTAFRSTAPTHPVGRHASRSIFIIAAITAAWSQPTDWWRRPWSNPYAPMISSRLSQPATYLLLDKPLAFVAPLLPAGSRFYTIADLALPILPAGKYDNRIRAGLKEPLPGGVWEMHIKGRPFRAEALAAYDLMIDASQPCVEIEGAQLGSTNVACPLRSTGS